MPWLPNVGDRPTWQTEAVRFSRVQESVLMMDGLPVRTGKIVHPLATFRIPPRETNALCMGRSVGSKEWSGCGDQFSQMRLRRGRVRRFRSSLPAGTDEIIAPVEIESCLGFG